MTIIDKTKESSFAGFPKVGITIAFALLAVAVVAIGFGIVCADDSDAAVNDTFTSEGLTYKVLTESENTGTVSVTAAASDLTTVVIPDTVSYGEPSVNYSVTTIAASAFSGKTSITSVTIGANVTEIGNYAFQGCTGLTTFTIPSNVKTLGTAILKGVDLQTLTVCTSSANCNQPLGCNPVNVIFTDGVSTIYYGYIGPDTTSITIGSSVSKINNGALNYKEDTTTNPELAIVTRLTNITNNSPNFELDMGILYKKSGSDYTEIVAMIDCDETVNLTIPETVTLCHAGLFAYQTIGTITWNSGTTYIPSAMFYGCTFTTDFSIPSATTYVSSYAFQNATFTEDFTIPSLSSALSSSFKGATFEKAFIFNGKTSIGSYAFENAVLNSFT